jgi:hypothetical protein
MKAFERRVNSKILLLGHLVPSLCWSASVALTKDSLQPGWQMSFPELFRRRAIVPAKLSLFVGCSQLLLKATNSLFVCFSFLFLHYSDILGGVLFCCLFGTWISLFTSCVL